MNEKNYSVYIHTFPDGKKYIGLTKQSPDSRWQNGEGYKNQPVYNAIQKFGWENITHDVVSGLTKDEAREMEIALIKENDTINRGYNVASGGGCGGSPWEQYEYNGKLYTSDELAELSDIDGLTGHDITNRINYHGYSIEEALTKPLIHKNQTVTYNGRNMTYNELANLSSVPNIKGADINYRLRRGWTVARALTQPKNVKLQPKGIGNCIYEYNGVVMNSYELWKHRKLDCLTQAQIVNRINHHGWSVEDAISKPIKKTNVLYTYHGEEYTTDQLAKLYPENNLEGHDITDRLRNGWTLERAVETPKIKRKKYQYQGTMMSLQSIYNLNPQTTVSYGTFVKNIGNGMSIGDALQLKQ